MLTPQKIHHYKSSQYNKGVILIISVILLIVLSGIGLAMLSTTTITSKASNYTDGKIEAQQKADAIATYVLKKLQQIPKTSDLTTYKLGQSCSSQPCVIDNLNAVPANIKFVMLTKDDINTKNWWRNNGQLYPNANVLQNSQNINNTSTSVMAHYIIYQDSVNITSTKECPPPKPDPPKKKCKNPFPPNCGCWPGDKRCDGIMCECLDPPDDPDAGCTTTTTRIDRTLKIVAYATDAKGIAAATKELYYVWTYLPPQDPDPSKDQDKDKDGDIDKDRDRNKDK